MNFAVFSGHSQLSNGTYTGAMGNMNNGEINETLANEDVAKAVDKWLEKGGANSDLFIIPRKHLSSKSLEDDYKLPKANAKKYDCIVEIHFNAHKDADNPMGTECLYTSSNGKVFAQRVNDKLDDVFKDREIKHRDDLYMLTKTNSPAIIVEVCFCDSKADCDLYFKHGADAIGKLIAEGLINKSISGNTNTTPSGEMYRVRKSWSDATSQKGAYSDLENAKRECDKHTGYSVFNSKGESVYPNTYLVKVTADALNIRQQPTASSPKTGQLVKGDVYTIIETNNNWGKLKFDLGWICLDYTVKC